MIAEGEEDLETATVEILADGDPELGNIEESLEPEK